MFKNNNGALFRNIIVTNTNNTIDTIGVHSFIDHYTKSADGSSSKITNFITVDDENNFLYHKEMEICKRIT